MSLPRLLVVLLIFFSLSIAFAENKSKQRQKNSVSIPNPNPENTMTSGEKDAMYTFTLELLNNRRNGVFSSESVCYTMRTYVAHTNYDKKIVLNAGPEAVSYSPSAPSSEKQGATLTEPYTTCTPSLRFDVRTTIQPVETVNDGK